MDCIYGEMETGWGEAGPGTSGSRMLQDRHSLATGLGSWSFPKSGKGTFNLLVIERQPWGWGLLIFLGHGQCPQMIPDLAAATHVLFPFVSPGLTQGRCGQVFIEMGNIMAWLSPLGVVV